MHNRAWYPKSLSYDRNGWITCGTSRYSVIGVSKIGAEYVNVVVARGSMSPDDHPWEQIYRRKGRGETNPFHRFNEVVNVFKEAGCSEILDLGCGGGRHLIHLTREGFRVVGMDISPTALRLTYEWIQEEQCAASLIVADMRKPIPFMERSFDAVFSTQVIHHARIAVVRGTIQEIFRVLGPGGLAFITVSARKDDREHIEIEPNTFVPLTGSESGLPHHIFTEGNLRRAFQAFQIQEISLRAEGKIWAVLAQKR
jgi:SAM-dependent methyltransferase